MSNNSLNLTKSAITAGGGGQTEPVVQVMEATLDTVKNFERNPRFIGNAEFQDIKHGLKDTGASSVVIQVTKRPTENHFITYFGAGTRLRALKELYGETNDQKYYRLKVAVYPYPGEALLINNHLAENHKRSPLSFVETAVAVLGFKVQLEEEMGITLSDAAFAEHTQQHFPFRVVRQRMPEYRFITELNEYCPVAVQNGMGRPAVRDLIKVREQFNTLCEKIDIADSTEDIFNNALLEFQNDSRIQPDQLITACLDAAAQGYTDLPQESLWGILNEETDINIPAKNRIIKKKGISLDFIPSMIADLVQYKDGKVKLTKPPAPLDKADQGYSVACVTYYLLIPLAYPTQKPRADFVEAVRDSIGVSDMTCYSAIGLDQYAEILKGLSKLIKIMERGVVA